MITREESDKRLNELADFLDALPPRRFQYDVFVGLDWAGDKDLSCGTSACALGWATAMPQFRALGLTLIRGDHHEAMAYPVIMDEDGDVVEWRPYVAAAQVFGVERGEAEFLFEPAFSSPYWWPEARHAPVSNASAAEVARHIRRFIEERKRIDPNRKRLALR